MVNLKASERPCGALWKIIRIRRGQLESFWCRSKGILETVIWMTENYFRFLYCSQKTENVKGVVLIFVRIQIGS